jgi:PPK2 family polyphosphate:nucleotide phosphotransferase
MDYDKLLVKPGRAVRLRDFDPGFTGDFKDKDDAGKQLSGDVKRLEELQAVFAAARTHALLILLQGMDTSGKDGAIKHVMSGVNPQGIDVHSFKEPTGQELAHDYLWRYTQVLPERGRIGVFNRSYYEEVLVVRVHQAALEAEDPLAKDRANIWHERFEDLNAFERHLCRNETMVVKFFLHISKDEQRRRLLARLDDPTKHWKFSESDVREREYWNAYADAYEKMLSATSTEWSPWYVIPSDHKWFTRAAVANILVERLAGLKLRYPPDTMRGDMLRRIKKKLG